MFLQYDVVKLKYLRSYRIELYISTEPVDLLNICQCWMCIINSSNLGLIIFVLWNYFICLTEGCGKEENWCCSICSILEWNYKESEGGRLYRRSVSFTVLAIVPSTIVLHCLTHSTFCSYYVLYRELELLQMPKNSRSLALVQWPLFLLASKVCWCP